MKVEYRLMPLVCGFILILAFIVFLLVPKVMEVRAAQVDLQILEARARIVPVEIITLDEPGGRLYVLSKDEFFESLAYIRVAALSFGLELTAFSALTSPGFDVSETTVRANLTGRFDKFIDYVYYLAGGVYNFRYLTLINADTASFDVWLSIFHEG